MPSMNTHKGWGVNSLLDKVIPDSSALIDTGALITGMSIIKLYHLLQHGLSGRMV